MPEPIIDGPEGAPATPDALHRFIREHLNLNIARTPLIPASSAPFDYLCHAFFEGSTFDDANAQPAEPSASIAAPAPPNPLTHHTRKRKRRDPDAIVWAARGGGKSLLAALATLLDLLFKPGVHVHLLAGSVEQGRRMHEHLRNLLETPALVDFVDGRVTARRITMSNGSRAELLAQSETSVRGCRPQKLRCDEVELFDRPVWNAAQLVTRSLPIPGPWGHEVRGSIDALSTMHRPFGLMWDIIEESGARPSTGAHAEARPNPTTSCADPAPLLLAPRKRRLFKWGVIDVLEHCPPWRECERCALLAECRSRAKDRPEPEAGHVAVADAVTLKSRVSLPMWQTEMLCLRPSRTDSVYPEFSWERHVIGDDRAALLAADGRSPADLTWVAGMDFGFRSPAVILLACLDAAGVVRIVDERVESGCTVEEHLEAIRLLGWPRPAWIGIDPAGLQVSDQTGRCAKDILEAAGHRPRFRRLPVHEGLMQVRARLAPADGAPPRLLVHRRCRRLIEALTRYHYDVDRHTSLDPVKDGPDHAADALRYLVINLDRPGSRTARYT